MFGEGPGERRARVGTRGAVGGRTGSRATRRAAEAAGVRQDESEGGRELESERVVERYEPECDGDGGDTTVRSHQTAARRRNESHACGCHHGLMLDRPRLW